MLVPERREFEELAAKGFSVIPVYREVAADLETPVSAFLKIARDDFGFLLESVSGGGEKWARYSFLGSEPSLVFRAKNDRFELFRPGAGAETRATADPFAELRREMGRFRAPQLPGLPRFYGGAVGLIGYDIVRSFEPIPTLARDDLAVPDLCLMLTDSVLIFDNLRQSLKVVANAMIERFGSVAAAYTDAESRIERLVARLSQPVELPRGTAGKTAGEAAAHSSEPVVGPAPVSNFARDDYLAVIRRAKEFIRAGDVIQVVTSQRFEAPLLVHPFNVYRALRAINPSPYMFYLELGDFALAGASPEVMVRVEGREVTVRPIAGTRPRGASEADDKRLEQELLADPKERAEHVMLVDLARNDVGRVARIGSVEVTEFMTVERYSHVMHLVSNVRGIMRQGCDAFDAFRATFPQGTVSGAPKVRAMQIIEELEPVRRGPYAGAVGYFGFTGNADTAITLRTVMARCGRAYVQAGSGIVADSDPEAEYEESLDKSRAMMLALEAAGGLEDAGRR